MDISYIIAWVAVMLGTCMGLIYVVVYLTSQRHNRKALVGVIAIVVLSSAVIVSLAVAQVYRIDLAKTGALFLICIYITTAQLIYMWTFPNKLLEYRAWRIGIIVFTVIFAIFAVFSVGYVISML